MGNLKKWGSYDAKAAEEEQEFLDKLGEGDFMKLKVGRNVVRVLPPTADGQTTPFVKTFQHFIELPGMTKKVSFNCPRRMGNNPCPACAKAEELRKTGNPADYELAGKFLPRLRVYCVVVDRSDEDAGPKVLPIGKTIHEDLVDLRNDPDGGGDFSHPEDGYDVIIKRTGTGQFDTEYKVTRAREESPMGTDEQMDEWLEMMPDMVRHSLVPTAKDIRRQLLGAGADEDDLALPAAGETVREPRAPKTRRRRTVEDDTMG
jgi:hypothetical protein